MKQLLTGIILLLLVVSASAQTWYQKEKKFVPYLSAEAAIGGVNILKDIHSWQGAEIWSGISGGVSNKNTSIGLTVTSYEWQKNEDTYLGLLLQRRLFYVKRFELWPSLQYSIPFKGKIEMKFQYAVKGVVQLHKCLAFEVGYEQVLDKKFNYRLTTNRAVLVGFIIKFHGNVNSNNK